jgi:hypothetical protein
VVETKTLVGRENVYTCPKCKGYTVTIDIDEGVTPFMLRCRANGENVCDGMATSSFYPQGPRPADIPPPSWEWYKPTGREYRNLSKGMKEHVDKGGLDIRARRVDGKASEIISKAQGTGTIEPLADDDRFCSCLKCGQEQFAPLTDGVTGRKVRAVCFKCGGQLVSNPRRG